MEFLQDPNVIYLFLAGGFVFAVLALASPGTGFIELGALTVLGVAGWSIITYDLPINWWALILVVVGAILFAVAVILHKPWPLLAAAIFAVVLGSAYMFQGETWYLPAVNPFLAGTVALLTGGFFWIVGRKATEATLARPTHDLDGMIGQIGEAKTHVHQDGSVQVASELWSARSEKPIRENTRVRVIGREGFTLLVEALEHEKSKD